MYGLSSHPFFEDSSDGKKSKERKKSYVDHRLYRTLRKIWKNMKDGRATTEVQVIRRESHEGYKMIYTTYI